MPLKSLAPESRRTLLLIAVLLPLLAVFGYVALNSGPLAPVAVVLGKVEKQPLTPALFGTGNVVARATHKVGPTSAGRLSRVAVQTGDKVRAGQWLAEVEPVDLDQRVAAQQAALQRADAGIVAARAQRDEAQVRQEFAAQQAQRYAQLQASGFASPELTLAKRQEWQAAQAGLRAAQAALASAEQERQRLQAEREASRRQRDNLTLRAPVDGWVVRRNADPGTTLLAGQAVLEIVEHGGLWLDVRFDQQRAAGLQAGLAAQIVLRSQGDAPLPGRVERIEPYADATTEEILAKVGFAGAITPPIGELAEVTVTLASLPAGPVIDNASIQRQNGQVGVWRVDNGRLRFQPVALGAGDLNGKVQVRQGLRGGEQVVVYSQKALSADTRIKPVEALPGVASAGSRR